MIFSEMDRIARQHPGQYFTTMAQLSKRVKNKRDKLQKLLKSKNINVDIYYDPCYHAWMVKWGNNPQRLGVYWRACEMIEKGHVWN